MYCCFATHYLASCTNHFKSVFLRWDPQSRQRQVEYSIQPRGPSQVSVLLVVQYQRNLPRNFAPCFNESKCPGRVSGKILSNWKIMKNIFWLRKYDVDWYVTWIETTGIRSATTRGGRGREWVDVWGEEGSGAVEAVDEGRRAAAFIRLHQKVLWGPGIIDSAKGAGQKLFRSVGETPTLVTGARMSPNIAKWRVACLSMLADGQTHTYFRFSRSLGATRTRQMGERRRVRPLRQKRRERFVRVTPSLVTLCLSIISRQCDCFFTFTANHFDINLVHNLS